MGIQSRIASREIGCFRTVSVMETTKGEFATPLFLFGKKLYICGMTILLILILITLLSINHKLRKQGRM